MKDIWGWVYYKRKCFSVDKVVEDFVIFFLIKICGIDGNKWGIYSCIFWDIGVVEDCFKLWCEVVCVICWG